MNLYHENASLYAIVSACLKLINEERSRLQRTKSQVPATSELWFLETGLKSISSNGDFLTWVEEKFSPQLEKHRSTPNPHPDSNPHLNRIFDSLALEIAKQVSGSDSFDKENQDFIVAMIKQETIEKHRESSPSTPLIYSDDEMNARGQNWSDAIRPTKF